MRIIRARDLANWAIGLTLALIACDTTAPGFPDGPAGWVALTAVYAETSTTGTPIQQIVLVNYDDPSEYRVVTPNDHVSIQSRFSPDKTKLLFGDETTGAEDSGPQFVLYDIKKGTIQPLFVDGAPLTGRLPVWNADGTGFYFHVDPQPFANEQEVIFYRLGDLEPKLIHDAEGYSTYPVGLREGDTLIVFTNKDVEEPGCQTTCKVHPFYLMDLCGAYLSRIENQHLKLISKDGVNTQAAYSPAWNNHRGLFAIAYSDSSFRGYKIAVTDTNGSYYREYTSGRYIDDHTRWGPDGETLLFDRRLPRDAASTSYRLMEVDLETGAVREFVEPKVIDGAVALRFPEY